LISFLTPPQSNGEKYKSLTLDELWYLATMGGASLCRLDNVIGNFEVGKEFDALRIRSGSGLPRGGKAGIRERFEKWVWGGDDRDLRDVWVRGRRVGGAGR
jgi:guanine deaminase